MCEHGQDIKIKVWSADQQRLKLAGVDCCMAGLIRDLNDMGMITTGCCCGHNKTDAYIGFLTVEYAKRAEELLACGWQFEINDVGNPGIIRR